MRVEQVENVPAGDGLDPPAAERGIEVQLEHARHLVGGPVARLRILGDELLADAAHRVRLAALRLGLRRCGVFAAVDGRPRRAPRLPRLGERQGRVGAEGQPALLAVHPVEVDPRAAAAVADAQGEAREARVEVLDLAALGRLQAVDGGGGKSTFRHVRMSPQVTSGNRLGAFCPVTSC